MYFENSLESFVFLESKLHHIVNGCIFGCSRHPFFHLFFEPKLLKMAKINEALVLLNDLIHSNVDDVIKMSKDALCNIQSCLQDAHEKIEFLQLESQLQQEELQRKSHHSEPVSV